MSPHRSTLPRIVASVWELISLCSGPILHSDDVMVTENKINALIKTADRRHQETHLQCRGWWASWPLALQQQEVLHFHHGCRAEEKKVGAKKEESKESDDDMGFGLFD
ncbi:Hypothetical predicted protein [Lynx pardinus]|uniref:Uncharacterized protein n=1 Tax=Lynx pardinus TaxID=191816 RepID=A0A485MEB4_LYNPA|nr:Hypothetical predicted protein [Lynx pardinus]